VVLRDHEPTSRLSRGAQGLDVDRLHGVEVDHARHHALLGQGVGRLQRLVQRDPSSDQRHLVVVRGANDLGAANSEVFADVVDHRRLCARRADEDDPVEVDHRVDELGRLIGVARVEHCRAVDRAECGEIFEPHLRGAVLTDRDARV
jgi:hypothetical protein